MFFSLFGIISYIALVFNIEHSSKNTLFTHQTLIYIYIYIYKISICWSTLKLRLFDVENETKSDVGFSALHNVNTMSYPDVETTPKQRSPTLIQPSCNRSSHPRCSAKKVFLEILQNSHESTCARISFLIKFQATWGLQLYRERDSGTVVFLWILRNF